MIKLLYREKLKIEHTKVELDFAKTQAETKSDNLGDFEKIYTYINFRLSYYKCMNFKNKNSVLIGTLWGFFSSEILLTLPVLGERETNSITYIKDDELGYY